MGVAERDGVGVADGDGVGVVDGGVDVTNGDAGGRGGGGGHTVSLCGSGPGFCREGTSSSPMEARVVIG